MPAPERVIIDRRGEQYAILPDQFKGFYEDSGFRIIAWEDGTAYSGRSSTSSVKTKAELIDDGLAMGAAVNESMTKAQITDIIEARTKELAAGQTVENPPPGEPTEPTA